MTFDPTALRQHYRDALHEARTCRLSAAVFDFSFVARGRVSGSGARAAVQTLVARNLDSLRIGQIAYAVRTDAAGFALSDVTVWRTGEMSYELMSGRRADIADLCALPGVVEAAADLSDRTAIIAVQGPRALAVLRHIGCDEGIARLPYFHFADSHVAGLVCRVGRLGYTGEAGFEIIASARDGRTLWGLLSAACQPAGFAAANVLRIEAGFVLLCNELKLRVRPGELRLGNFIAPPDPPQADDCRLVTFRSTTPAPPAIWQPQQPLHRPSAGELTVTSACRSPLVVGTLGLGFVLAAELEHAGRTFRTAAFGDVEVLAHPFYDTAKRRPRQPWAAGAQ